MSNTITTTATPAKLRSGAWGARIKGAASEGDVITVTTRAGKSWDARVSRVVWRGDGITLCATEKLGHYERRGSRGRGRWTGCSCGSREDEHGELIPSPRNCFTCEHDA